MAKINLLDSSVFNRIAAGEVVERPASVIKELVENSIDAGATSIVVEIFDGGKTKIKVSDNGSGIEFSEVEKAFMPHATSKIARVEDLEGILTLGFRGEALASIASVADVTLVSKPNAQENAAKVTVIDGKIEKSDAGSPDGTYFTVENLFRRVPARLKFLKSVRQEESEITNLISRLILANPNVSFRYCADGTKVFQSYGNGTESALFSIYGKEAVSHSLSVNRSDNGFRVHGFVGREDYTKANRTYQTLILNSRYIVNQTVSMAVFQAFSEFLMKRRYPFWVLYLDVPVDSVDVNVHPNKLEVRFKDDKFIFQLIYRAVADALRSSRRVRELEEDGNGDGFRSTATQMTAPVFVAPKEACVESSNEVDGTVLSRSDSLCAEPLTVTPVVAREADNSDVEPISSELGAMEQSTRATEDTKKAVVFPTKWRPDLVASDGDTSVFKEPSDIFSRAAAFLKRQADDDVTDVDASSKAMFSHEEASGRSGADVESAASAREAQQQSMFPQTYPSKRMSDSVRTIGTLFDTYVMVEADRTMILIDQHAAHERLLYDKLKADCADADLSVQDLLLPYVFDVNVQEMQFLEEHKALLKDLGIGIELYGSRNYRITYLPTLLTGMKLSEFVGSILKDLQSCKNETVDFVKDKLMQEACKAAVKGGDRLSDMEISTLLEQMSRSGAPLLCPHGRPIVVSIKRETVDKWFKRIVG